MPDPTPTPAPSEQGKISGGELATASWQSAAAGAAIGAAVVVLQGYQSGQFALTKDGALAALAVFGGTFATLALKGLNSGPAPTPRK